ncbi:hypothetical protein EHF33_13825 [Deinococcus psychrotolerans]|uniref:Uncharacterized protein n=1 Tax=Deinococcus psychrotolerans TaxID=2489213 RepID=A0A3G8YQN6_9DEIO|nr:hypothetical protein [Deinococcus psychrotolerans]AZI44001.1 hypothetical protein EHF33_13825 [Deinococcus psychrotolerans]
MNETANSARPAATTLDFVALELPPHWDGKHTIHVADDEGNEAQMTVEPCVANAVCRAALLARHGLCSRIDLGLDSSGLHIVSVYWES